MGGVLGISIGMCVRMGNVLSEDVPKAKMLVTASMIFAVVCGLWISIVLWTRQDEIVLLFTKDEVVMDGCDEIWHYVCMHIFMVYVYGLNCGILRALGKQWISGVIIAALMFFVALPAAYYLAIIQGGGILRIWQLMPSFYAFLNVVLALLYFTSDWNAISKRIGDSTRAKELEDDLKIISETTSLLDP